LQDPIAIIALQIPSLKSGHGNFKIILWKKQGKKWRKNFYFLTIIEILLKCYPE